MLRLHLRRRDDQTAAAKFVLAQRRHRLRGLERRSELNEAEAARPAREAIDDHTRRRRATVLREECLEIGVCDRVREITDESVFTECPRGGSWLA